jgi:AP-4 complex subunit epsilon-1
MLFPHADLHITGELKILLSESQNEFRHAAMRLRDREDDSCLWRLRCDDDGLRTRIRRLLTET